MRRLARLTVLLAALTAPSAAAHEDDLLCRFRGVVDTPDGRLYRLFECIDGTLVFEPTDCRDEFIPQHLSCKES